MAKRFDASVQGGTHRQTDPLGQFADDLLLRLVASLGAQRYAREQNRVAFLGGKNAEPGFQCFDRPIEFFRRVGLDVEPRCHDGKSFGQDQVPIGRSFKNRRRKIPDACFPTRHKVPRFFAVWSFFAWTFISASSAG